MKYQYNYIRYLFTVSALFYTSSLTNKYYTNLFLLNLLQIMAESAPATAGPSSGQQEESPSEQPYTPPAFMSDPQLAANIPEMVVYLAHNKIVDSATIESFGDSSRTHVERVRFVQDLLIKHNLIPQDLRVSQKGDELAMIYQCQATRCLEQQKPSEALYFFNKMVSLVDYESVGAPMSFAFRSSVFAKLGRWAESLEDAELAITSDLLEDSFLDKLLDRKTEATEALEKEQDLSDGSQTPFSYTPTVAESTKRMPKIANFIRLETSKKKGRRVLAKRDIVPGDIVAIARPFCHRLMPKRTYTRCQYCLSENSMRLIPCGLCTQSMYCGSDCMMEGRLAFHKMECPIIDFLHRSLNLDELLIVRMTLRAVSCFKTIAELRDFVLNKCQSHSDALNPIAKFYTEDQKALHQILRLRSSENIREGSDVFRRSTLAALITTMLVRHTKMKEMLEKPEDTEFFMDLMMRMAFIADFNTRELRNMKGDIYAKGIYPFVSLLNHSCSANVDRFAFKDEMVLVTNRKIAINEELTTNFGFYFESVPVELRQEKIMRRYGYKCQCEACTDPGTFVLRKDLPPHGHHPPVSYADKKIIVSGYKEKAKNVFDDCAWKLKKCQNYPSSYIIEIQDGMRLAYNGLLGNAPEHYDL